MTAQTDHPIQSKPSLGHEIGLGIALLRALLLISLGVSLLFIPEKTNTMLFNAIGLFWLTTGLVLLRRHANAQGSRLMLALAILGVLAGALVITRSLTRQFMAEGVVMGLLGGVILLTGILHATSQLRLGRQAVRGRPIVNLVLGIAEILLGALLLIDPTGQRQTVYYVAIAWALLGGGLVLFTTVGQWLRERREHQAGQAEEQPEVQAEQAGKTPGEQPEPAEQQAGEQA